MKRLRVNCTFYNDIFNNMYVAVFSLKLHDSSKIHNNCKRVLLGMLIDNCMLPGKSESSNVFIKVLYKITSIKIHTLTYMKYNEIKIILGGSDCMWKNKTVDSDHNSYLKIIGIYS